MNRIDEDYDGLIHIIIGGIVLPSILTLLFVILKVCNVIEWNWFWILSPTIFSIGIYSITVIIAYTITSIIYYKDCRRY